MDVVDDPSETMIRTSHPAVAEESLRSPSFPEGARRVIVDIVPESAWDDMFLTARDNAGDALLTVFSDNARLCVGTACSPREFMPQNLEIDIVIEPAGWSVRHDGIPFASGSANLGTLDHLTFRGAVPLVRDARAYGVGGHVDAALRTDLGGFTPYVERLAGEALPFEDPAYSFDGFGLVVNGNHPLRQRTLIRAELEPGPWAFQTHAAPHGAKFEGYALLAGLDAQGRTLWRVEVDRAWPGEDTATLHFREGSLSAYLGDLSSPRLGWQAWIAAHGEPEQGLLSLRVRNVALPPIPVASLPQTVAIAFGDATSVAPETLGSAAGAGRMTHMASFVAKAPAGYEV